MRGFRVRLAGIVAVLAIGAACPAHAATSRVSEARMIRNWHAFTRLYGYVRWFHPTDEAAATDWDGFAILGAREVRNAPDDVALRRTLDRLFRPLAPSLLLYEPSRAPPPETIAAPADSPWVAWQHKGVAGNMANQSPYRSLRVNRFETSAASDVPMFGTVTGSVDAAPLRGRDIRLRCAMRAEVRKGLGTGQMWLRVDLPNRKMGFFDNMADRPVLSPEWTEVEIAGNVDTSATEIWFGAFLQGSGAVEVDDFRFDAKRADGSWEPVAIANPGFEQNSTSSRHDWILPASGYQGTFTTEGAREGKHAMRIINLAASGTLFTTLPSHGETFERDLVPGLRCRLALSLPSLDGHTEPQADVPTLGKLRVEIDAAHQKSLTAADEAVRVAGITILWNVTQHFWPYFDVVRPDWETALDRALTRTIRDRTPDDHALTLRRMTAPLEDGHVVIRPQIRPTYAYLPASFAWAEGRVVVARSSDDRLRSGDVVRSIDGRNAVATVDSIMATRSGTERYRRAVALRFLDRGPDSTIARLEIERDGKVSGVEMTRSATPAIPPLSPEPVAELEPGIWYVDLDRSRMSQIDSVMTELAAAKGVIFDARGYPNGTHEILSHLTDVPLESAIWQVPRIIRPDHQGPIEWDESGRWKMPAKAPRLTARIVFLIGSGAISYAESVLGIVENYRLGELVGEATAGTNGNINLFRIPGGFEMVWTGMRVLKHDRSDHHNIGIRPTVPVARTIAGIRAGRDEVLDRGLAIARGGTPAVPKP